MDLQNQPDRSEQVTTAPTATVPAPPEDAPLTVSGWLAQNGVVMLFLVALVSFIVRQVGLEGLPAAFLAAVGLGFLIFIHELGHFLAAKWCDVHVKTFSIGFGPAIPGLHFTLGETLYMIGILPLGGYVNMVGEGTENDEDESNPRSFKAKGVFQRMVIISAGVIMNILFGLLCFVVVYLNHGVDRPPATVWRTEAGSPAWEKGVRAGSRVTKIGDHKDPYFDDLKYAVAHSAHGAVLNFEFTDRDGKVYERSLQPFRDDNSMMPTIGVIYPHRLRLFPKETRRHRATPYTYDSVAAFARPVPLERDDVLVKIDGEAVTGRAWDDLCTKLKEAGDETIELTVKRGDKQVAVSVPPVRFDFGDTIVATTNPATPDEPFNVEMIPLDPTQDPKHQLGDPFEYRRRLYALAGKPMVIEVSRGKESERLKFLVPPAYHYDLGARMKMGKVSAVRIGSGAEKAGLAKGDEISQVGLKFKDEVKWMKMDPVRLPDLLYAEVHAKPKERPPEEHSVVVKIWVTEDHRKKEKELPPMPWDDSWGRGDEAPIGASSPMSIPQVGIAYQVDSTVVEVVKDSPADKAGLKVGDEVVKLNMREMGRTPDEVKWSSKEVELDSKRDKGVKVYDQWAYYFYVLQRNDHAIVKLWVKRGGALLSAELGPIEAVPDLSWPLAERGLLLTNDTRRQKAGSFGEAIWLGTERSVTFIKNILLNLRSLATRRVSTSAIGGPIEIAAQAFNFANEPWHTNLLFLGIISINLAVVNFLPIPILDGGHMVFLLYEWVRGKPPPESVRNVATIIGLVLILSLMLFVFYQDAARRDWLNWMKWPF